MGMTSITELVPITRKQAERESWRMLLGRNYLLRAVCVKMATEAGMRGGDREIESFISKQRGEKKMKIKVTNRIPGQRAKDKVPEERPQKPTEEIEKADESLPETIKPENRESADDKSRKSEARKEFEAGVRGKLKYSRKR
jgi:hypothetical protein